MEDKTFSFPDDVKTRVRSLLAKQLEQTGASNLPDSLPDALLTISAAGTSKEMIAKNLKAFLGKSGSAKFAEWMWEVMEAAQEGKPLPEIQKAKPTPKEDPIRALLRHKLSEIAPGSEESLPAYVLALVRCGESETQIAQELEEFLGVEARSFARWLWQVLPGAGVEVAPMPAPPPTSNSTATATTTTSGSKESSGSSSNRVCRFYLQGNCTFGDRCRYSHNSDSSTTSSSSSTTSLSTNGNGKSSTSAICRFFLQGSCQYGNRCHYSHSTGTTGTTHSVPRASTPTNPCREWTSKGSCRFGDTCRYDHAIVTSTIPHATRYSPSPPVAFCPALMQTGFCQYGDRCHFAHTTSGY